MDCMFNVTALPRTTRPAALVALLLLSSLLAACSGSTGPAGPPGPTGPPGPPGGGSSSGGGSGSGVADISAATGIVGTINSVTIGGPPVVKFQLADPSGAPLKGLTPADISFGIAQLVPGLNGTASQWNSYLFNTVASAACPAGVASCAPPGSATQATTEAATSGTLVDNGDGTYQYTFLADITKVPSIPYNAALTHRVAFQIKNYAQANNGAYTFQPSTGATTGIFSREIVETATCNNCHTFLSAHGGSRVEVQYCVMCHNPGTTDPESGSTVDFKVMVHKIHTGINLPSIQTASGPDTTPTYGQGYWIIGNKNSVNNFNTVLYPQDTRNCLTCHVQGIPTLPDAANYNTVPTIEACGACHDTVNFATGTNHAGGVANDSQCATCHSPTGGLSAASKHVIPEVAAAAKFQFLVNNVSFVTSAGSIYPVVNFSVVDPTNDNAPYNILTDAPFVGIDPGTGNPVCASGGATKIAFDIAWDSRDYTNWGTGATADDWGQPISLSVALGAAGCTSGVTPTGPDATGAFTMTSTTALPPPPAAKCPPTSSTACPAVSNVGVVMEGRTGVVTTGPGAAKIPVTSAVGYGNASGAAPVARRTVVDSGKCNVCHSLLSEHGGSRNGNVQVCTVCHNPASTDVSERQTLSSTIPGVDGLWEQAIDFKFLIHSIHNASNRPAGSPFVIYGHGGSVNDFTSVIFPGQLNRCDACHVPGTYYPVDTTMVQATTFFTGFSTQVPNPTTPGNPIATSPTMTVCSTCHIDASTLAHMEQNGGSTTLSKDAEGRTIPNSNPANNETCSVCHGSGGVADVRVMHNVPAGN
jgi:OmcA/MtrC family decaheme c-type cytochrome